MCSASCWGILCSGRERQTAGKYAGTEALRRNRAKTGLDRYKAILIADSDNDAVNGSADVPAAERARQAAGALNSYTVYPLTLKTYSDIGQRWTIPLFTGTRFDALIDWAAFVGTLSPQDKTPVEAILPDDEDDWDEDGWDDDDWDDEWEYDVEEKDQPAAAGGEDVWYEAAWDPYDWENFDWDEFAWEDFDWEDMDMDTVEAFLDCVPTELIWELPDAAAERAGDSGFLAAVTTRMAEKDVTVLSPAGWRYSLSKGGRFLLNVRTDRTELLNVLLDGKALTEYRKDFDVIGENTGSFLMLFSETVMQGLNEGEHTITLDINGIGTITRSISVEK